MKGCLALALLVVVTACGMESGSEVDSRIDGRLYVHAVEPSTPTVETAAYLAAVSRVHAVAEQAASQDAAIGALRHGLALPVPAGLGESEVVRLELTTRLGEVLGSKPGGANVALETLAPLLDPRRSLPLDAVTAKALVVQGDLAVEVNDMDLAVSSYSRAIRLLSMLREELEP